MFYGVILITFIFWMLARIVYLFNRTSVQQQHSLPYWEGRENPGLEWGWTLLPAAVLAGIAVPAFGLLFTMNDLGAPALTLKVVGHQWFWSYEYGYGPSYDDTLKSVYNLLGDAPRHSSQLVQEEDLVLGQPRLLQTDWVLRLPICTRVRVLVTSTDVLHS